jgi:methyl-accepting chemotaxis protein
MRNGKSKMRFTQKLYIPNILYLIIFIAVVVIFFSSSELTRVLSEKQQVLGNLTVGVRNLALNIKAFKNKEITFSELDQQIQNLDSTVKGTDFAEGLAAIRQSVSEYDQLSLEKEKIEKEIESLIQLSIKQSNGYIEQVSNKLADENQRSQVTTLERLVIIGANINTTSNYELQLRFLRLKESLAYKDEILEYIDAVLKNTEKDMKQLEGTPFAQMPVAANEANRKVNDLTLAYINHTEKQDAILNSVFERIKSGTDKVDEVVRTGNEAFFNRINGYFSTIVIVLLAATIIGIVVSIYLARSIARSLNVTISDLTETSDKVAEASGQVSQASQSLAEGTSEQAAALEETSSSLEEMASMTRQNAESANQVNALMGETRTIVIKAGEAMEQMKSSMDEMSGYGQEIGKIIKTIDEIAFQTNLLALNAAVEAARAGEAGAGFAVVADEVRSLAQRAAEAARNTAELIETTVTKIGDGNELVKKTGDAFDEVVINAAKVADLIGEIAAASSEQAQGIEQVSQAVEQMDSVVQNNAASAEESAGATDELNNQADSLKEAINELLHMVGGQGIQVRSSLKNKNRQTAANVPHGETKIAPRALPPAKSKKRFTRNSDEVISMDDEFTDF